jgi:hypothetical protein
MPNYGTRNSGAESETDRGRPVHIVFVGAGAVGCFYASRLHHVSHDKSITQRIFTDIGSHLTTSMSLSSPAQTIGPSLSMASTSKLTPLATTPSAPMPSSPP